MAKDFMRYDTMVQESLRDVVRKSLLRAGETGLPGEHHFYIAFRTDFPGVEISDTLRSRYPQEMTIVLQHQFWGLEVHDEYFEVGLSFNRAGERLHIPFAAMKGFYDPSVQFGLEFTVTLPDGTPAVAPAAQERAAEPAPAEEPADKAAAVVSLDAFRKKS